MKTLRTKEIVIPFDMGHENEIFPSIGKGLAPRSKTGDAESIMKFLLCGPPEI